MDWNDVECGVVIIITLFMNMLGISQLLNRITYVEACMCIGDDNEQRLDHRDQNSLGMFVNNAQTKIPQRISHEKLN